MTRARILGASLLGNSPWVCVSTGKEGHVRSPKSLRYPQKEDMGERPSPAAALICRETPTGVLLMCSAVSLANKHQLSDLHFI